MKQTDAYFRAILEHCGDAIVTADQSGHIVEWNPAAERMFGWTRAEMLGQPAERVWEEPEERRKLLNLVGSRGRVIDYETRLRNRDGKLVEVSITMSQLKDEGGKLLGTISISKDIRKRKRMERDLKRMAMTDTLTGLFNRAHFNERVVEEVARSLRMKHPMSLALLDLDGFKEWNDGQGHQAGDAVLRKVGRAVLQILRRHVDTGYRYGGDEFTFIFPETGIEGAQAAAERLRARIEGEFGGGVTASIGMATLADGMAARDLIRVSDRAMYRAKGEGGNRVRVGRWTP